MGYPQDAKTWGVILRGEFTLTVSCTLYWESMQFLPDTIASEKVKDIIALLTLADRIK